MLLLLGIEVRKCTGILVPTGPAGPKSCATQHFCCAHTQLQRVPRRLPVLDHFSRTQLPQP